MLYFITILNSNQSINAPGSTAEVREALREVEDGSGYIPQPSQVSHAP